MSRGKATRRRNFDNLLTEISDGIGIDTEFESRGNAATDQVFEVLKSNSRYSLDRLRVCGGKAKRTSIHGHVDYDCVVFVNVEKPPFRDVITEFRRLLVRHLGLPETDVKVTPFSLQFSYNGVDFDLLPAHNEVETHDHPDTVGIQVSRTLAKIKASTSVADARYHSSAASEGAVEFVRSRDQFVKRVIKLCKYWNHGVTYDGYISGRSTLVELIAIQAAEDAIRTQNPKRLSLRLALTLFIARMCRLDKVNVSFYEYYNESDVPSKIQVQRPLVLDVTNPKNNLLCHMAAEARLAFQREAKRSVKEILRLNRLAFEEELQAHDIQAIFN